jgi:hypothetical protein
MRLAGPDSSLDMQVLGYQFEARGDCYDDNWLSVSIHVKHPRGQWHSVDPSLQTTEVMEISDWLASLSNGQPVDHTLSFTEPNLLFRLVKNEAGEAAIRVYFELECRPAWAPSDVVPGDDLWIELPIDPAGLAVAAASLRDDLAKFPVRVGR